MKMRVSEETHFVHRLVSEKVFSFSSLQVLASRTSLNVN